MAARDTRNAYGFITRYLHWATAAAIAVMLAIGWSADALPKSFKGPAMGFHISLGVAVLALGLARLGWRVSNRERPARPAGPTGPLARAAQWTLIALLVIMPLSGWMLVSASGHVPGFFGLFHLPPLVPTGDALRHLGKEVHETLPWVLVAVLALHVLGALKHHYLNGDDTLRRMLHAGRPARIEQAVGKTSGTRARG